MAALIATFGVPAATWVGDRWRGKPDLNVTLTVQQRDGVDSKSPTEFVFPGRTVSSMPVPEGNSLSGRSCSGVSRQWVQSVGGYESDETWSFLTISADKNPLVIQSFKVETRRVDDPAPGAVVVSNPCGDGQYNPFLLADLDTSSVTYQPPDAGAVGSEADARKLASDRNPDGRLIPKGGVYSVPVVARAGSGVYTWTLKVRLLVDGVPQDVEVQLNELGPGVRTGAPPRQFTEGYLRSDTGRWSEEPPSGY